MAFELLKQATVPGQYAFITAIENVKGGSSGSWRVGVGRSYTVRLKVQTSNQYVGAIQVIQSVAPTWGAYYRWPLSELGGSGTLPTLPIEQDTGSFLQEIKCDPDGEDGMQYLLTLEYGPFDYAHEMGDQAQNGATDPTTKRPEVAWSTAKYEVSKPQDESDPPKWYINTVGDPLVDHEPTEESRPILTITRAEPLYNSDWLNSFKDHVNNDEFLGYAPNVVKCKDITGKQMYDPDWGIYWDVTYEFEFRPGETGWDLLIENAGYREKKNGTGDPVPVIIGEAPASEPVMLQVNGAYVPGADPVYITFKQFKSTAFAPLAIPEDILTATI